MVPGIINTLRFTPTVIGGPYRIIWHRILRCPTTARCVRRSTIDSQKIRTSGLPSKARRRIVRRSGRPAISLANGDAAAGAKLFGDKCSACTRPTWFREEDRRAGVGHIFADPEHPKLVNGTAATPETRPAFSRTATPAISARCERHHERNQRYGYLQTWSRLLVSLSKSNGAESSMAVRNTDNDHRPPPGFWTHPSRADDVHPEVHLLDRSQDHRVSVLHHGGDILSSSASWPR